MEKTLSNLQCTEVIAFQQIPEADYTHRFLTDFACLAASQQVVGRNQEVCFSPHFNTTAFLTTLKDILQCDTVSVVDHPHRSQQNDIAYPLCFRNQEIGILEITGLPEHLRTDYTYRLLAACAAGLAGEYAQLEGYDPHQCRMETISQLLQLLNQHDSDSYEHSQRVSWHVYNYLLLITNEAGIVTITETQQEALLHDIGKLFIARSLLIKPGKYTAAEAKVVQMHPEIATYLAQIFPLLRGFAPIIGAHHIDHDGTGYPQTYDGLAIPLRAALIHIWDTVDALLSERSYKPAWSLPRVITHLKRYSGTQFHPAIVPYMEYMLTTKHAGLPPSCAE